MDNRQNPKHSRRSIRLRGHDYGKSGLYYVTLCTRHRLMLFGEIAASEVRLNEYGRAVAAAWMWLREHHIYVDLDSWILMPNHLHGIVVINEDSRKPLGRLIGAFKTVSTKRINEMRGTPGAILWQRDFYEHIIRDEADLQRIRKYIADNPRRWDRDRNH